jgi:hypothetical protein
MNTQLKRMCWSCVLVVNLVMPLRFAGVVTRGLAWYGVGLAIATCWLAGMVACRKAPRIALSLVFGGVAVALSQFWPMLQFCAGILALQFCPMNSTGDPGHLTGVFAGFLATTITAACLLAVAFLIGVPLAYLVERHSATKKTALPDKSPIFDEEFDRLA